MTCSVGSGKQIHIEVQKILVSSLFKCIQTTILASLTWVGGVREEYWKGRVSIFPFITTGWGDVLIYVHTQTQTYASAYKCVCMCMYKYVYVCECINVCVA